MRLNTCINITIHISTHLYSLPKRNTRKALKPPLAWRGKNFQNRIVLLTEQLLLDIDNPKLAIDPTMFLSSRRTISEKKAVCRLAMISLPPSLAHPFLLFVLQSLSRHFCPHSHTLLSLCLSLYTCLILSLCVAFSLNLSFPSQIAPALHTPRALFTSLLNITENGNNFKNGATQLALSMNVHERERERESLTLILAAPFTSSLHVWSGSAGKFRTGP